MDITNPILFYALLIASLVSSENSRLLLHWKSRICEPDHPNFIFYETNLSDPVESVLNRYLVQQTEPYTVITTIHQYLSTVPFDSCPFLFLESSSNVQLLEYAIPHRKLIVTSVTSYRYISSQFTKNEITDAVYFVFDQSQLAVHYYDNYQKRYNRWTALKDANPLLEAAHDLAGAAFVSETTNALEAMFAEFIASELNATLRQDAASTGSGLIYTHRMAILGAQHHHIFMHRTSRFSILVPRLDSRKAAIFVLVDPFDAETWLTYGSIVLVVALFRTICTQRWRFRQYLSNLQDVIACVVLGSPIGFHHQLEQLIVGLFQLLSIVLMAAYESLVISFLLNPRFDPELDTMELLNDSCCWLWSGDAQYLNFRHIGNCLSVFWMDSYIPVAGDRGKFNCYMIATSVGCELNKTLSNPAIAKHYRWSKVSLYPYPVMAIANGGVGFTTWISHYAGVFFAEAALFRFFESGMELFARGDQRQKVIELDDLMLLWIVYFSGVSLCLVVFLLECCRRGSVV